MSVSLSFRRLGFALGALVLASVMGCNKSSGSDGSTAAGKVTIKGKVTFDRIPLVRDTNGLPTGLETDPTKYEKDVPARNVIVNLYQKHAIPDPAFPDDRTKDKIFFGFHGYARTADGAYSFEVPADNEWMVEVQGSAAGLSTTYQAVNVLGDPAGMSSTVPQQYRLRYCLRKAPDGTAPPTAPGVNHVASSKVSEAMKTAVVDFHVGVSTPWFLSETEYDHSESRIVLRMVPAYSPGVVEGSNLNRYSEAGSLEPVPSGSRILSILDAFVDVVTYQGSTISSSAVGPDAVLDLHYRPGHSEPKGTYIEWDRSTYPEAWIIDATTGLPAPTGQSTAVDTRTGQHHYFGSIRGAAANDDAWDRGPLTLLAAKAHLFLQARIGGFYAQQSPLGPYTPLPLGTLRTHQDPQMALVEGMPYGLTAIIQKNPYIADTSTGPVTWIDVRDMTALPASDRTPFSGAFLPPLMWEMALKAQTITSPGTPTTWSGILPSVILPFVTLRDSGDYREPINFYTQLRTMQSTLPGQTTASPFTDAGLQDLFQALGVPAGNIPWPRPATGPLAALATNWGENPSSLTAPSTPIQPFVLSMAQAVAVGGVYDNTSRGEIQYARFSILPTRTYALSVDLPGGPLTGGQVEVTLIGARTPDGQMIKTYTFTQSSPSPIPFTFQAINGVPSNWMVRVRMLSPTTLQPDTTVKVSLVPAS